jgi:hypothetical protein
VQISWMKDDGQKTRSLAVVAAVQGSMPSMNVPAPPFLRRRQRPCHVCRSLCAPPALSANAAVSWGDKRRSVHAERLVRGPAAAVFSTALCRVRYISTSISFGKEERGNEEPMRMYHRLIEHILLGRIQPTLEGSSNSTPKTNRVSRRLSMTLRLVHQAPHLLALHWTQTAENLACQNRRPVVRASSAPP